MQRVAVALPVPLRYCFDYLCPAAQAEALLPGVRVRVPFGRRRLVGVVVAPPVMLTDDARDSGYNYKSLDAVLDTEPLLPAALLALCRWCADYYHHALGEVIAAALPAPLRAGNAATLPVVEVFCLTAAGCSALPKLPTRATASRALLERLDAAPATRKALAESALAGVLTRARAHGWVEARALPTAPAATAINPERPQLTPAQQRVLTELEAAPAGFSATLLEGVTGSGKTELYLRLAEHAVAAGRQVLALAPEIGLTPQLAARFAHRFGARVACYHSGMGEAERARSWLRARAGEVDVVVGTRSAIFMPLARPGLIIVDEEHDTSYKQQDGLRYSARDLAVLRAREEAVPVVLGSATPSLESLHNAASGRYRHVRLTTRISTTPAPRLTLLDVRNLPLNHGLSEPLLQATGRHLESGGQVLLFINRRGFAPVLLCHQCGWIAPCPDCNARLTLHRRRGRLLCHHCGYVEPVPTECPGCGQSPLTPVGQGTERIEEALRRRFPGERVERIDSDRAHSASALTRLFEEVRSGAVRILVGTQILAKGHDFAGLTLAGLVDVDQALYGSDFRAMERMGQLVTQVAGRVGRADRPGEVILQTHASQHPQLRRLVNDGYAALAQNLLAERRAHGLPPFAHLALMRAESPQDGAALNFLQRAHDQLNAGGGEVELMGPVPAPMERRAGRHRAQLLLKSAHRSTLQQRLRQVLPQVEALRTARSLRWSLDVDPADLF